MQADWEEKIILTTESWCFNLTISLHSQCGPKRYHDQETRYLPYARAPLACSVAGNLFYVAMALHCFEEPCLPWFWLSRLWLSHGEPWISHGSSSQGPAHQNFLFIGDAQRDRLPHLCIAWNTVDGSISIKVWPCMGLQPWAMGYSSDLLVHFTRTANKNEAIFSKCGSKCQTAHEQLWFINVLTGPCACVAQNARFVLRSKADSCWASCNPVVYLA